MTSDDLRTIFYYHVVRSIMFLFIHQRGRVGSAVPKESRVELFQVHSISVLSPGHLFDASQAYTHMFHTKNQIMLMFVSHWHR